MTEQIWREFNAQLLIFIQSRINDKTLAKDILQEIFIKIHQKADTIQDEQKITSWVYQITRNTIIDFYRKKSIKTAALPFEDIISEKSKIEASDFSKCLIPFMNELPSKDQEILKRISFENISQKEYAEQHNLSYSATKSRIQRARAKLKRSFIACCDIQADKYGNIISHTQKKCDC